MADAFLGVLLVLCAALAADKLLWRGVTAAEDVPWLAGAQPHVGAVYYVDSLYGSPSNPGTQAEPLLAFDDAVDKPFDANASKTIILANGTYVTRGGKVGEKARLTIIGQGAGMTFLEPIANPKEVSMLSFYEGKALQLNGLTIRRGRRGWYGGCVWANGATFVRITKVIFSECGGDALVGGGAIALNPSISGIKLIIDECSFMNCRAGFGGAVQVPEKINGNVLKPIGVYIRRSLFRNNTAFWNNGALEIGDSHWCMIDDCTFENNSAVYRSGAVGIGAGIQRSEVRHSIFRSNFASAEGAGRVAGLIDECFFVGNMATGLTTANNVGATALKLKAASSYVSEVLHTVFEGNTCQGNTCQWEGGALNISPIQSTGHSPANIYNCTFERNCSPHGAAVYVKALGAPATFVDCSFRDNSGFCGNDEVWGRGGSAIRIENFADIKVENAIFARNVGVYGGAIWLPSDSVASFVDCTFESNNASSDGGAIYSRSDYLVVSGCVFASNYAAESGGGIRARGSKGIYIGCSTFEKNVAGYRGGALTLHSSGSVSIERSVFHNNSASNLELRNDGGLTVECIDTIIHWSRSSAPSPVGDVPSFACLLCDIRSDQVLFDPCACTGILDVCTACNGSGSCIGGCDNLPFSNRSDCQVALAPCCSDPVSCGIVLLAPVLETTASEAVVEVSASLGGSSTAALAGSMFGAAIFVGLLIGAAVLWRHRRSSFAGDDPSPGATTQFKAKDEYNTAGSSVDPSSISKNQYPRESLTNFGGDEYNNVDVVLSDNGYNNVDAVLPDNEYNFVDAIPLVNEYNPVEGEDPNNEYNTVNAVSGDSEYNNIDVVPANDEYNTN